MFWQIRIFPIFFLISHDSLLQGGSGRRGKDLGDDVEGQGLGADDAGPTGGRFSAKLEGNSKNKILVDAGYLHEFIVYICIVNVYLINV